MSDAASRVRRRTLNLAKSKAKLALWREEYPPSINAEHPRPATRGDCPPPGEPCPHVSCRYHLALDVTPRAGNVIENFPDRDPDELPFRCVLDEAEHGGLTLEEVGARMNLTRRGVHMIEKRAFRRLVQFVGEDLFAALLGNERSHDHQPRQLAHSLGGHAPAATSEVRPGPGPVRAKNPCAADVQENGHLNARSARVAS